MKNININVKTMHNVEVWLKRANEANFKLVKEAHNTSGAYLKEYLRDCTYSNQYDKRMGFNGLFTTNTAGGYADKDGIVAFTSGSDYSMITTAHATDPSGNYYKRWTGILTAPKPITINGNLQLGTFDNGDGTGFANVWCTVNIGSWVMGTGDILKVHWKASLTGANAILLTNLRNALTGDSEDWYLGDNGLFATQEFATEVTKDGLLISEASYYNCMITAVHPTDPSGNYYRRWQGVFTAPSAFGFTGAVSIGTDLVDEDDGFDANEWDNDSLSAWLMAAGDILKVNWKVSIS